MVTIREVANRAGVSIGTVSRVVNNKPGVSESTRERVLEVVKELGYVSPSRLPLLISKVTHLGALVRATGYPLTADPFYGAIFQGVEKICHDYQISVSFGILDYNQANSSQSRLRSTPALVRDDRIRGIVIMGAVPCSIIESFIDDFQLPIVLVDNYFAGCPWDSVMIDNLNGACLATEHLIAHGHKQISFIGGPDHPSINERKAGYKQAIERHHLTPHYFPTTDLNPINGEEAASELLLQAPETTALFCANDLVAIGALKKFQGLGFKVPDDFSIVGFDDIYTVSFTSPPVTTIHVDRATMGQISAELLLGRIKYPERAVINTTIGIKLIERDSVCAPRLHTIGPASQRESSSVGA